MAKTTSEFWTLEKFNGLAGYFEILLEYTLNSLEEIHLEGNSIGSGEIKEGKRNARWKNLRKAYLTSNRLGDKISEIIASWGPWLHLEEIYLSNNNIDDQGAVALANDTQWKELKIFVMESN